MTTEIIPTETTKKRDKGFTLVELLIVIAILGVLATITVLSVRGISNNSQKSTCQSDKKTFEVAMEAYYASAGAQTIPSSAAVPAEQFLVNAKLLQNTSPNVNITPSMTVTAEGSCVGQI